MCVARIPSLKYYLSIDELLFLDNSYIVLTKEGLIVSELTKSPYKLNIIKWGDITNLHLDYPYWAREPGSEHDYGFQEWIVFNYKNSPTKITFTNLQYGDLEGFELIEILKKWKV
jgi:hypothetical protein